MSIKIVFEAIIISGIIGYFFSKSEESMKTSIEEEFSKRDKFFLKRNGIRTKQYIIFQSTI